MPLLFSDWVEQVQESADCFIKRTVLREMAAAARDIYETVPALERTATGLTATATVSLPVNAGEEVASILSVSQGGVPLTVVTIAQLNSKRPSWRALDVSVNSSWAIAHVETGTFTPIPPPDTSGSPASFDCTYSVMPTLSAVQLVDTAIANRHKDLIVTGTLGRLYKIPGMPVHDSAQSKELLEEFWMDVAREKVRAERRWSSVAEETAQPLHGW